MSCQPETGLQTPMHYFHSQSGHCKLSHILTECIEQAPHVPAAAATDSIPACGPLLRVILPLPLSPFHTVLSNKGKKVKNIIFIKRKKEDITVGQCQKRGLFFLPRHCRNPCWHMAQTLLDIYWNIFAFPAGYGTKSACSLQRHCCLSCLYTAKKRCLFCTKTWVRFLLGYVTKKWAFPATTWPYLYSYSFFHNIL